MAYGTLNADQIQSSVSGVSLGGGNATLMKNRIINGAMVIDQRNAGASITPTGGQFSVDRFGCALSQSGKYTAQQNSGAVTPPTGFSNYLGVVSQSAYSILTTDYFFLYQGIEGFNFYDLGYGTANAKTITLSFWVQSSLTGTFGGAVKNGAGTISYPFSYSIPTANTWTQISITIPGPTTGTWVGATNTCAAYVQFGFGVGTTYSGTAGSWQTSSNGGIGLLSCTGAVSVVGTSGATFYITGVQFEVGSVATGFEYRHYQQELALCQRYFELNGSWIYSTASAGGTSNSYTNSWSYKVPKRTVPTLTIFSGSAQSGSSGAATFYPGASVLTASMEIQSTTDFCFRYQGVSTYNLILYSFTASSEL